MLNQSEIQIVVVNYRTANLVIDCLFSLKRERDLGSSFGVVVVDNDSPDDSVDCLRQEIIAHQWEDWVTLLPLNYNGGFAFGNNRGIEAIRKTLSVEFLILLNPDTLVREGTIDTLVRFMRAHPKVGIAGSRLEHRDGTVQNSAFRAHSFLSEFETAAKIGLVSRVLARWRVTPPLNLNCHQADWVAGACMIVRAEVFDEVRGLDEGYFMYYEEVDFCLRVREAGWLIWYVPEARVVHLVGQSSGVGNDALPRRRMPLYWFESRRRYFLKNHGRLGVWLADAFRIAGHGMWAVNRRLRGLPECEPSQFLGDFIRYTFSHRIGDLAERHQ